MHNVTARTPRPRRGDEQLFETQAQMSDALFQRRSWEGFHNSLRGLRLHNDFLAEHHTLASLRGCLLLRLDHDKPGNDELTSLLHLGGADSSDVVQDLDGLSPFQACIPGDLLGESAFGHRLGSHDSGTDDRKRAESGKRAQAVKILDNIAAIGTTEVKKAGKFVIPGLVMIKTKKKAATKAGKKMMFGQEVVVKAKPAKTVVKAFPAAALKKSI